MAKNVRFAGWDLRGGVLKCVTRVSARRWIGLEAKKGHCMSRFLCV